VGPYLQAPVFAIDNSDGPFRNRIYFAWMNRQCATSANRIICDGFSHESYPARLFLSYSSDRGKTWAKPRMVAPGTPGQGVQFGHQTIAVNNEGTVAVGWYDTRDTPAGHDGVLVNRYLTASVDGRWRRDLSSGRASFLGTVRPRRHVPERCRSRSRHGRSDTGVSLLSGCHGYDDYLGMAADSEGTFFPIWRDGRTGRNQIWTARVRVERTKQPL
jgi:hypothetical protein